MIRREEDFYLQEMYVVMTARKYFILVWFFYFGFNIQKKKNLTVENNIPDTHNKTTQNQKKKYFYTPGIIARQEMNSPKADHI